MLINDILFLKSSRQRRLFKSFFYRQPTPPQRRRHENLKNKAFKSSVAEGNIAFAIKLRNTFLTNGFCVLRRF